MPGSELERPGVVFSVVIPVYGNRDTLPEVIARLHAVEGRIGVPLEAVLVIDGSPDDSLQVLQSILPTAPIQSQLVVHSRNFGSFPAIWTGLGHARGEFIGVMAADLQEPAELLEDFYRVLSSGEAEVAVGRRSARADPAVSSLMSRAFWGAYRRFVNPQIPKGGVDIFALTREVAGQVTQLREAHSSLVGLLYWVGFRRVEVEYARQARTTGKSGWTFRKRVRYLLDSVFAFTDLPIHVLSVVGAVGAALTTLIGVVVFGAWIGGAIQEPGYTPLMLTILFSTFLLLSGLGVVGSYVWRTYENSKSRPPSVVMAVERFDGS